MSNEPTEQEVYWRVHTARLLGEIMSNPGTGILLRPLQILAALMAQVGIRASQLNDPELNALMCQLTIYAIADPDSPDYDPERTRKIIAGGK